MTTGQLEGVLRITRLARHAERRSRLGRSIAAGSRALAVAIAASILVLCLRKVGLMGELAARICLLTGLLAVLASAAVAWAWALPEYSGARSLDRFYGLHDRLANALAFAVRPDAERTAFMNVAIDDAVEAARDLRPRVAVPVRMPPALGTCLGLATVLAGVALLEVRRHVPLASVATLAPIDFSADDIDDVKDFLAQLAPRSSSDEVKAAIEEINRLVSDIASQRLDRTEVFRRIEALEMKLMDGAPPNREALERSLRAIGDALKKADLSRPVASALEREDLAKARDALRDLAQKVRTLPAPVDKAKLDELRDALKKASQLAKESRSAVERRRQQLADEIARLKDRTADGGSDEERSLLQKDRQELERLDRNLDEQRSDESRLDRLDRELEQAAEDLAKDLGLSAGDLEQGAEDLNRLNEEQMSQQEKETMRQRLEELRELVRQQRAGGSGQVMRLKRFARMARGQGGEGGGGGGSGSGDGQPTEGDEGQGQKGGSPRDQAGQAWVLGPNGEKILFFAEGPKESRGGGGEGRPQRGAGEGHDPRVQGTPTQSKMTTEDTQVQGSETGQGTSRSEVILGAAQRGFSAHNYRKVFTEYHQVAEESLARDEIPGGYRFYVKRYFQLIRPREER
jgi:hypothetical protein